MSAYRELAEGRLGDRSAEMLYKVFAAVARLNRFPPPDQYRSWTEEAVHDVAHDFLADDGPNRFKKLMLRATDDVSLQRLLERSVRNYMADRARETVKGRLSRAIQYQLDQMEDVTRLGGQGAGSLWMHEGSDRAGVVPSTAVLVESSYRLPGLQAARSVADPKRGRPMIPPASLAAVIHHCLVVAGAPLDTTTLVDVTVQRFPVVAHAAEVPLSDVPAGSDAPSPTHEISEACDAIWAQMTVLERLVVPYVDGSVSVRQAAAEIGVSKSAAQRAIQRSKVVMSEFLLGEPEDPQVAAELLRRSSHLAHGTRTGSSTSSRTEGGPL